MEIIKHILHESTNIPNTLKSELKGKKICFLDIETTGFSRKGNHIVLIGILSVNNNSTEIVQFFAENPNDEHELLCEFKDYICDFDTIITFNGESFDIPFINDRFDYHNINSYIDKNKGIDILKAVRKNKNTLGLSRYNLKSVEDYLGIERQDKINGRESVQMYYEYINTKDDNIKDIILRHNYDDIYNLPKIMKIYDIIADKNIIDLKLICRSYEININIDKESIEYKENIMLMKGNTNVLKLSDEVHYGDTHVFKWSPTTGKFEINFEIQNGKLSDGSSCKYIDTNNFKIRVNNVNKLNYDLPETIILVEHNKILLIDNVKIFIGSLWKKLISLTNCDEEEVSGEKI